MCPVELRTAVWRRGAFRVLPQEIKGIFKKSAVTLIIDVSKKAPTDEAGADTADHHPAAGHHSRGLCPSALLLPSVAPTAFLLSSL